VLELNDLDVPEPATGQVRVEIRAAGVNFIDTYHRTGLYPVDLPYVPGQEAAGFVHAVGDGVEDFKVGDRVVYQAPGGSYAQYRVVTASRLVKVPEHFSFELAAAMMLQGMTAHYLVHDTVGVGRGDTILAHAAAGGVGLLLVQMAKMKGARVIGTAGSQEKIERARSIGADEMILYTESDFLEEVMALTDGEGVDVVYDSVGQSTFDKSLECLRTRGTIVSFGQSSGPVPPFEIRRLSKKSLHLTRPTLTHYTEDRNELVGRVQDLIRWIDEQKLDVKIDSTFPLENAASAHERIESRESSGKILLCP
ncbi:MAG: quinone oxidoreductase, partial [Thermoanaerobaculia bacterium]|nr:quinone oxidoreductase [Thermoanaerobaculia bacterium]